MRLRTVWDTNSLIQALANPKGHAGQCWTRVIEGTVESLVSHETMAEVERVIGNPGLRDHLKFDEERSRRFLQSIRDQSTLIEPVPAVHSIARDSSDECFLNLAIAGQADVIVTNDRDLREFPISSISSSLQVMTPSDFLRFLWAMEAIALGYE